MRSACLSRSDDGSNMRQMSWSEPGHARSHCAHWQRSQTSFVQRTSDAASAIILSDCAGMVLGDVAIAPQHPLLVVNHHVAHAGAAGAGPDPGPFLRGGAGPAGVHALPRLRAGAGHTDLGATPALCSSALLGQSQPGAAQKSTSQLRSVLPSGKHTCVSCCLLIRGPWESQHEVADSTRCPVNRAGSRKRQEQPGHAESQALRQRVQRGRGARPQADQAARQGQVSRWFRVCLIWVPINAHSCCTLFLHHAPATDGQK